MRFFSYGRKSVFSDKSDSIDNQFRMNREYCESKFSSQVDSWQQFSDEDADRARYDVCHGGLRSDGARNHRGPCYG